MLAFKNDIGFWKNNKSMLGLSGGWVVGWMGGWVAHGLGSAWQGCGAAHRAWLAAGVAGQAVPTLCSHRHSCPALPAARSILINAGCQLVIFL